MTSPENPIPSSALDSDRRWPQISSEIEAELLELERLLGVSTSKDATWTSEEGRITHTGPHMMQSFQTITVTHHLSDDEKQRIKDKMVGKTFERLHGTPGEEIAKELIARANAPQAESTT